MAFTPDVLKATAEAKQLRDAQRFGSLLLGFDVVELAAVVVLLTAQGLPTTAVLMEELNYQDHQDKIDMAFVIVLNHLGGRVFSPLNDLDGSSGTPDANLDSADGFSVGSIVVDSSADVYFCLDNTAASAVWKKLSP